MFTDREALIHFVGGAMGGTAGTAITCPLEVIKTRLQSSRGISISGSGPSTSQGSGDVPPTRSTNRAPAPPPSHYKHILGNELNGQFAMKGVGGNISTGPSPQLLRLMHSQATKNVAAGRRVGVLGYLRHVVKTEGFGALYKGLGPNLVGVAPAKAVYFYTYSGSKRFWNESDYFVPNSAIVHMISAGSAGFVAASAVNPIWLVKTRLQLHQGNMSILQMIKRVYQREGIKGFYKGVTASYAGVSETMIQFVIYEHLRGMLMEYSNSDDEDEKRKMDFVRFMGAGGTAKFIACVIAYPHEVVRTRLREESDVKRGFFRTLFSLYQEGVGSMYRGLSVQLMRTVPSTAITMSTYELVVYLLHHL